jgi:thiol-disulfide isomerase/thioredoxin
MKRLILIVMLTLTVSQLIPGQNINVAEIIPDKPKQGGMVTITYNPLAEGALLKNAPEINLEVLYVVENLPVSFIISSYDPKYPVLKEYKMIKTGDVYQASFTIDEPKTRILVFRFASGELLDENEGKSWYSLIYKENNTPVENACAMLADMLTSEALYGQYDIRIKEDRKKADEEYKNEMKYNPMSLEGATARWSKMWQDKEKRNVNRPIIMKEVDQFYEQYKDNDRLLLYIVRWYDNLGDTARFREIEKSIKENKPSGSYMFNKYLVKYEVRGDTVKQDKIMKEIFAIQNMSKEMKKTFTMLRLVSFDLQNRNDSIMYHIKNDEGVHYLQINASILRLLENDYKVKELLGMAKQNIAKTKDIIANEKPVYFSKRGWEKESKIYLADTYITYALACEKNNMPDEAYKYYTEAYKVKNRDNEFITRYTTFLNKAKRYNEAVDVAQKAVEMDCYNSRIIAEYKRAYIALHGSDEGYQAIYNKIKGKSYAAISQELRNTPAPDFEYKYYDGRSAKLSDLKGKIVVLDLWAISCSPCRESLPALQKIYNKYKNNENIVFLALNTGEKWKGEERIKNVKKFADSLNYTFPIVINEGKDVFKIFDLDGIPTKFIIDREGKIQFKDLGFSDEDSMIDDMTLKIDMLLENVYKEYLKKR